MKNLKLLLTASTLTFLASILLMSCVGCGGLNKGDEKLSNASDNDTFINTPESKDIAKQNSNENSPSNIINDTKHIEDKINNSEILGTKEVAKENLDIRNKQFVNNPNTIYAARLAYGIEEIESNSFRYYPNNFGIAVDKNLNIYSKIFKYDSDYNILFDVNILKNHPYITENTKASSFTNIQQLDGIHHMISVDNIATKMPLSSMKEHQNSGKILHSRVGANTFIQKDEFLSISYFTQIIPNEEILEFIQIPSLTTIEIYKKGELLVVLEDLPFNVEEIQITKDAKYAVLIHHEPINSEKYDQNEWNHFFSVYNVKSKKLCFRKKIKNQFSSGLVGKDNNIVTAGFEEFYPNKSPITFNYYIREEKEDIVEWVIDHNSKTDKHYKYVTQDGILYTLPNQKEVHLMEFNSSFNSFKLNCK